MERTVQVELETHGTSDSLDYDCLLQARDTVDDMEGVNRVIGLIGATKTYLPNGNTRVRFQFRVDANHLCPV